MKSHNINHCGFVKAVPSVRVGQIARLRNDYEEGRVCRVYPADISGSIEETVCNVSDLI
jgi:hypothetical protein